MAKKTEDKDFDVESELEGISNPPKDPEISPEMDPAEFVDPVPDVEISAHAEKLEAKKEARREESNNTPEIVVLPQEVVQARTFLENYGIKHAHLTDKEVMQKIHKIDAARRTSVQVLSRGKAIDGIERALQKVPEGYVGEFRRDRDVDIQRAEALGWTVFIDEDAKKETPTQAADNKVKLGDQILMIIPEEEYVGNWIAIRERREARRKRRKDLLGGKIAPPNANTMLPVMPY